jgi:large subunit ribosomal protein L32
MALKPQNIIPCPECKRPVQSHRACAHCGAYRGRKVTK